LNHPKILILLTAVQWKPTNAIVNSPTANQAFCRRRFAGIEMFFLQEMHFGVSSNRVTYATFFQRKKTKQIDIIP
jgi:hypothetical protein